MLYKFKSPAAADLIMLEPHGRRVLGLIGKDIDARQGILLPEQMPAAIAALETAVTREEAERRAAEEEAAARGEELPPLEGVTLRQRATPLHRDAAPLPTSRQGNRLGRLNWRTPRLRALRVAPPPPLQGATPAARRSRFRGVPGLRGAR